MPTILKIGWSHYVVRKASDAAAVVKALADAVSVDSSYVGTKTFFFPTKSEREREISMFTIPDSQIVESDPNDAPINLDDDPASPTNGKVSKPRPARLRWVNGHPQLMLGNGGQS